MTDHEVKRVIRGIVPDVILDAYLPREIAQKIRTMEWKSARQNAKLVRPYSERNFSIAVDCAVRGAAQDHNAMIKQRIEKKWNQLTLGLLGEFLQMVEEIRASAELLARGAPEAAKHLRAAASSLKRAEMGISRGILAAIDSGALPKRGPLGTDFERGLIWRLFAVWAVMLGERPSRKKVEPDEVPVFYHFAHRVLSVCEVKGGSAIAPKQPRSLTSTARNLPRDRWKIISPLLEASKERKFVEVEGAEPWMLDMVIARIS